MKLRGIDIRRQAVLWKAAEACAGQWKRKRSDKDGRAESGAAASALGVEAWELHQLRGSRRSQSTTTLPNPLCTRLRPRIPPPALPAVLILR